MRLRSLPLLLAATLLACVPSPDIIGRTVDFRLPGVDAAATGPPDYEGSVVLLEFWATWCGPCRLQAETLEKLAPQLESLGVVVLSVNVGESESLVRSHLARTPSRWPVLLDQEETVSAELRVNALPTLVVLDAEGRVSAVEVGVRSAKTILQLVDDAR